METRISGLVAPRLPEDGQESAISDITAHADLLKAPADELQATGQKAHDHRRRAQRRAGHRHGREGGRPSGALNVMVSKSTSQSSHLLSTPVQAKGASRWQKPIGSASIVTFDRSFR